MAHALAEDGVTAMPSHYKPLMMIDTSGMRMVSIVKNGDAGGNTIELMSVENAATVLAKSRELKAHPMPESTKSLAMTNFTKHCTGNGSYDVETVGEMVPVRVLSCNMPGHPRAVVESASFMTSDHPSVLVGMNLKGKFDEWAFKQLVGELGSQ